MRHGRLGKLPYMAWYPGDWRKDAQVLRMTPLARGIWREWLDAMYTSDRTYKLSGTAEELGRIGLCSTDEAVHAIQQLQASGAADVHRNGDTYTVVSRRFKREHDERKSASLRQLTKRQRDRHASVTPLSQVCPEDESEGESESDSPEREPREKTTVADIENEAIYTAYPRRVAKQDALRAIAKARKIRDAAFLLAKTRQYAGSLSVRTSEVKHIPHPATWFNRGSYDDEPQAWEYDARDGKRPNQSPPQPTAIPMKIGRWE
jgi:hypothetical protein